MKILILISTFLLVLIIYVRSFEQGVSVKCPNNITVGNLTDYEVSSVTNVLNELFKINSSNVHYFKLENENDILEHEMHPFINAVHLAYAYHLNLIISPDMIWHLIATGTSSYINQHAEEVRKTFVEHEGQIEISVHKDNFQFNSTENRWDEVIDELVDQTQNILKLNSKNLFNSNFSTTTRVSSIASKIVLMEAMQKYFKYKLYTLCGIPDIKLLGNKEDWLLIKEKIVQLNNTLPNLTIWYNQVHDIIKEFINVFDNKIDYDFWNKIYKVNGGSGGPYISGWVMVLFPYLRNNSENYFVWEKHWTIAYNHHYMSGLITSDFPMTLSKVPFVWNYYGNELSMSFIGGMFGINYQYETKSLRPVFGYAVVQD